MFRPSYGSVDMTAAPAAPATTPAAMIDLHVAHLSPCASRLARDIETLSKEVQDTILKFVGDNVLSSHYCLNQHGYTGQTLQTFLVLRFPHKRPGVSVRAISARWIENDWSKRFPDCVLPRGRCEACGAVDPCEPPSCSCMLYIARFFMYKRRHILPDTRAVCQWLLKNMYIDKKRFVCASCRFVLFRFRNGMRSHSIT